MHSGKQIGIHDVFRGRCGDHLLVAFDRVGFGGGNKSRSYIGEVGAEQPRRAHRAAIADRTRQRNRSIEPMPGFSHECERRYFSGMAAGAGRYQDQAVRAFLDRLVGESLIDHVVKHDTAPAMRRLIELFARAQRSDHHRHLVLLAQRKILFEPVVRSMHDLIDRERRGGPLGMRLVVGGEFFLDPHQPLIEQRRRSRV